MNYFLTAYIVTKSRLENKKNDLINFKGMINILISKTTDNLDLLKSKLDIAQNPCDKFFNDSEIPPKFVQIASNY